MPYRALLDLYTLIDIRMMVVRRSSLRLDFCHSEWLAVECQGGNLLIVREHSRTNFPLDHRPRIADDRDMNTTPSDNPTPTPKQLSGGARLVAAGRHPQTLGWEPGDWAVIEEAARLEFQPVTKFVQRAAIIAARKIIRKNLEKSGKTA